MDIDVLDGLDKIINKDKLLKLSLDYASDIAYLSRGLDKDEILAYYGLAKKEISAEDKRFIDIVITRGKTQALAEATKFFFASMQDPRTAASSSLSYLTRFSEGWNVPDAIDAGKEKFVFKMVSPK